MWSHAQRNLLLKAVNLAGWTDQLRYVAMRACGCPLVGSSPSRPSVKATANTHEQFAAVMMLAESAAKTRGKGASFPKPGGDADTWTEASLDTSSRVRDLIRRIWAEAHAKMPAKFPGTEAALTGFVERQTKGDAEDYKGFFEFAPANLDECDLAQCTRVLEGLKAWVGREFYRCGIRPQTFYIPPSAIAQVKAEARRHTPGAPGAPGASDHGPQEAAA